MGTNTQLHKAQRHIAQLMRRHDSHVRYLVAFVFAAILVAFGVEIILSVDGIAATHTEQVLDCHFSGDAAHSHDESCYDAAGNLVCPLPERELHTHTDDCYTEERTLVCGLDEGPDHEHTDACYEVTRTLTCGQEELTTEHVHGPGCFETITVDDGDYAADETDATDGVPSAPDAPTDTPAATDAGQDTGESQAAEQDKAKTDETDKAAAQHFSAKVKDQDGKTVLKVDVDAPEGALPAGTTMVATWVDADDMSIKQQKAVEQAVSKETDGAIVKQQAVDLTFYDAEGNKVEPTDKLTVTFASGLIDTKDQAVVVHMDDLTERELQLQSRALKRGKSAEEAEPTRHAQAIEPLGDKALAKRDMNLSDNELAFESDQFSTYVLAVTTLHKVLTASDGTSYTVKVDAPAAAGVSQDDDLAVREILADEDAEAYDTYAAQAQDALGQADGSAPSMRLFDIKIVDAKGDKVEIAAPVAVSVDLTDTREDVHPQVVHFADEASGPDVVTDVTVDGTTVSFEADGFSVYAIVDEPHEPYAEGGDHAADSFDMIADRGSEGFYLSHQDYYLTGGVVSGVTNNSDRYGLAALTTQSDSVPSEAALFYFERVEGTENQFYIYTKNDSGKHYAKMTRVSGNNARGSLNLVDDRTQATAFTLEKNSKNEFRISGKVGDTTFYWNRNGNSPGEGAFVGYTGKDDKNTAWVTLHYVTEVVNDPHRLNGKSFGIAYHTESVTSVAVMAAPASNTNRLAGQAMSTRPDVLDNEGVLLVAEGTDISEWTFENVSEDKYYLTTMVDGQKKYLTIDGGTVKLLDSPDEAKSLVRPVPGTGANVGKWQFTVGNRSLNFAGSANNGFNTAASTVTTTWLNLVEKSPLSEDDFTTYTAKKVSISDTEEVYDGKEIVIYTRVWNDDTKRYEYFAVDHDGSLIRCYDVGGSIQWLGGPTNTATWDFIEHTDASGEPNYYYDLQNSQLGEFLAPQVTGEQVTSDEGVGLILNGRRYGRNYSTIVTWDDDNYTYAGLKVENGRLVPCPLAEADSFYAAIMVPTPSDEEERPLSEVDTVDNDKYGITMKMIDYNNQKFNSADSPRDTVQDHFFGSTMGNDEPGMLSTNLDENGYPTATSVTGSNEGRSLRDLYTASPTMPMMDANHLFIESTHNESGYFEYDSTQNFAHFNTEGDKAGTFTVYDQLGAIGDYQGYSTFPTGKHGQFLPYDDLVDAEGNPKPYCDFTNQSDVNANELSDFDPRKGESLFNVGTRRTVDYNFGMEMEASFTQTANGLDAWGHDIIFEFSGDDDFWFYVDGELVLDLGGTHRAMSGSINFRTGEVQGRDGVKTALRDIFESNYRGRGMSESEIESKLDEIFEEKTVGDKKVYVFKDYTDHHMKMFYMERGAGASNLHMRFNLAAVKPGTFVLGKKLSGTDNPSNDLIEFPYQIFYTDKNGNEFLLPRSDSEGDFVKYQDTTTSVPFAATYTPPKGTEPYQNVFFLKPGEAAEVRLPEGAITYRVVECGVNPNVYDSVSANDTPLTGNDAYDVPTNNKVKGTARHDYRSPEYVLKDTSRVTYDNHVKEGSMRTLSITKWLYDSDGNTRLHYDARGDEREDQTLFDLRLFLGNERADAANLPAADQHPYYVKDRDGSYCRWDASQKKFVPLGIATYEALSAHLATLTNAEKDTIIFKSSPNGSISKVPADYTIEVRDLIVDTQFKVEERAEEIPRGYTLRLEDGYQRVDAGAEPWTTPTTPISGTIEAREHATDEEPHVRVNNQKGWGLTVKKVWTDQDFMESHDPIYFAVFTPKDTGANPEHSNWNARYELVEGSVRQLAAPATELYYFFDRLKADKPFEDFVVFEVEVESPTVDDDGVVTHYHKLTPLEGSNATLVVGGTPVNGVHQEGYHYDVTYQPGEQTTQNENVRTDTVTNSRPGIKVYKKSWAGEKLAGATFTLKDAYGSDVAAKSYTSREDDGLVTIVYVSRGTYTLTETATPQGYVALPNSMGVTVAADGNVSVSGVDESFYKVTQATSAEMATITIKNRPVSLTAKKVDASTGNPLEGAHFALYAQVIDAYGKKVKYHQPMTGYEDLVTDARGIIPKLSMDGLARGKSYYLTETVAVEGYDIIHGDLCFTLGLDGTVLIDADCSTVSGATSWLKWAQDSKTGELAYTITIPNGRVKKVQILKVDVSNTNTVLPNAAFVLYQAEDFDSATNAPRNDATPVAEGTTDAQGVLPLGDLAMGEYVLVETAAPDGYLLPGEPISLAVSDDGVTLIQAGNNEQATYNEETDIYQVQVWNTAGIELPNSGGMGSGLFSLVGALLVAGAALVLACRRAFVR